LFCVSISIWVFIKIWFFYFQNKNKKTKRPLSGMDLEQNEGSSGGPFGQEGDQPEEESILIPVHGSDEFVSVSISGLPKDANDIVDILKAELAPLDVWLKFAVS